MKRLLGIALTWAVAAGAADEALLRAMRDEMARSRVLRIVDLNAPYYIEYELDDADGFRVSASLGALVDTRRQRFRIPRVEVRVGGYDFDNTNYVLAGFFGGARLADQISLDDDYIAIRNWFWLATDREYKGAVEGIARKRAALKNVTQTEKLNDFARAEPVKKLWELRKFAIDEPQWTARVRSLSALFSAFAEVQSSSVDFEATQSASYHMNSEGTEVRYLDTMATVRVRAAGQASDGMTVRDAVMFHAFDPARLPREPELSRGVEEVARNLTALRAAPRGEPYAGPVLFEGIAAAQLMADVLGSNLALTRRPVTEPGRPAGGLASEFEGRIGARILPEWMEVIDDPSLREWRARPLFGFYEVDSEGVLPKPLTIVEKGVLKSVLMTRQPVRGVEGSNGRARLPGNYGANAAHISNLFVRTSDAVPLAELKKKLMEMCRQRNKTYGVIVRKMDYPSSASGDELRRMGASLARSGGASRPVSVPILLYQVDVDGKEQLVRGLRFRGLSTRSLRDIVAASQESIGFDYLGNNFPFAMMGAGGFVAPASVISPSLLFEDLELEAPQEEQPAPPLVPPPPLTVR